MEPFTKDLVSDALEEIFSRQKNQFFHKLVPGATKSAEAKGCCNFGNVLPIKVQNVTKEKFIFPD